MSPAPKPYRSSFRDFQIDDRDVCLDLLRSNTPEYFTTADCDWFARFLSDLPGPFFVAEQAGVVVACGGWALHEDSIAMLTWGIVRRDRHREGLGSQLLRFRIEAIRRDGRARIIRLRTVQQVQPFFERYGFRSVDVVKDGFGEGFDCVTMECAVAEADRPHVDGESR